MPSINQPLHRWQYDITLARGGNTTKFLAESAGFFYSDANGGNVNGAGTLRVGFLVSTLDSSPLCEVKELIHRHIEQFLLYD
jgi:hypothetical protein